MVNENALIGLPLAEAQALCEEDGLVVIPKCYTATKPLVDAVDERVIRARLQGKNIELTYSIFKTDI